MAPPYGVADGPYTRHYAKWLIPDPAFDGVQVDWLRSSGYPAGKTVPEGRTTRNSFADGGLSAGKSRSQRGSAGQKLHALSSGYPPVKEKAGPCVLKRSDGQMVKLVCLDCQRENFSSTQGFINHCRIAHRRDFKSHEEAAVASGQPIELDEVGGIVGEEKQPQPVATGLVHPLIRSAPADREAYVALLSRIDASMNLYRQGKLPGVTSIPTAPDSPPPPASSKPAVPIKSNQNFVPSPETPHLSNLMRSRGFDGDLGEIVGEAKKHFDLDEISSNDGESESESPSREHPAYLDGTSDAPPMRVPARANVSPGPYGRPGSSKGADHAKHAHTAPAMTNGASRISTSVPVIDTAAANHDTLRATDGDVHEFSVHDVPENDIEMMDVPSMVDLSPNTIASNNAPSLVSDDSEYEDDGDAESTSSANQDEDSDVAEIDIEDGDGVDKVVSRSVLRHRAGAGRKEDKHVTFVSPMKEGAKDRRRRK